MPARSERVAKYNRLLDRKSTRLNSSHSQISYAVFCLKKKTRRRPAEHPQPTAHGTSTVRFRTTSPGFSSAWHERAIPAALARAELGCGPSSFSDGCRL